MATWPSSLQQKLNARDFSISPSNTVLTTEMDYGPAKKRRRYTDATEGVGCSIVIDLDEYTTLMSFFNIDCAGGATPFDFIHPITQVPVRSRWQTPPAVTPMGGLVFAVSMQWEFLP